MEQEQPKRTSLERCVVGKTKGEKGKKHKDEVRGRCWASGFGDRTLTLIAYLWE